MTNHFKLAVEKVGGQSKMAEYLRLMTGRKITQPDVWYWLNKAKKGVPAEYCGAIEEITGGKVRAVDLRPDIFVSPRGGISMLSTVSLGDGGSLGRKGGEFCENEGAGL